MEEGLWTQAESDTLDMKIKLFRTSLKVENMWIKDEVDSDEYYASSFLAYNSDSDTLHLDKSHFDLAKRFLHALGGYKILMENSYMQVLGAPDGFA